MKRVNVETLSCYLDGNLDFDTTVEISQLIEEDPTVQQQVIKLLKAECLLKAYGKSVQEESVPKELVEVVTPQEKKHNIRQLRFFQPFLRIAVVMVVFVTGFLVARINHTEAVSQSSVFPEIPATLAMTVNRVLEFEKSGTVYLWNSEDKTVSATITPVKSYRGNDGQYYRYYMIDLRQDGTKKTMKGIAHRQGKAEWKTDSISTYIL